MNELLVKYVESINYEEIKPDELTLKKLESLESKEGLILDDQDSTSLWIHRELSVHSILGVNTVMESTDIFSIMDDFGMVIWSGDAESVIEYVKGFIE